MVFKNSGPRLFRYNQGVKRGFGGLVGSLGGAQWSWILSGTTAWYLISVLDQGLPFWKRNDTSARLNGLYAKPS
jgi:hypothetical protein